MATPLPAFDRRHLAEIRLSRCLCPVRAAATVHWFPWSQCGSSSSGDVSSLTAHAHATPCQTVGKFGAQVERAEPL
eukprot:543348-Pleurochrysis_carterae.AAC.3